jgi:hypothetical protein
MEAVLLLLLIIIMLLMMIKMKMKMKWLLYFDIVLIVSSIYRVDRGSG